MEYNFSSITIKELVDLIDKEKIDLAPPYQRKDIWSRNDQESLIDSILLNYPLPNFFMLKNKLGIWEMVDGQQRARTIHRFYYGSITDSNKKSIADIDKNKFENYKLSITEIKILEQFNDIAKFYVLVNKKGKHLNTPELHKAGYNDSNYLKLSEELLDLQGLINLNLFTDASSKRMNDRNFIEELIAYLVYGIQDKKRIIENIYKEGLTDSKVNETRRTFTLIIDIFDRLNDFHSIKKTRYKQKNDFYTFFNFVSENINQPMELFIHQYKILLLIDQYISPSNEECTVLREYALNCVSQSNSKKAREGRLQFFNSILKNREKDISKNKTLSILSNYIDQNQLFDINFDDINGFYLINVDL